MARDNYETRNVYGIVRRCQDRKYFRVALENSLGPREILIPYNHFKNVHPKVNDKVGVTIIRQKTGKRISTILYGARFYNSPKSEDRAYYWLERDGAVQEGRSERDLTSWLNRKALTKALNRFNAVLF